jgi:hypothetical protein
MEDVLLGQEVPLAFCDFFKALPPDVERAEDVGEGPWRFQGIASDESADVDSDEILRKTLDLSYAQSRGFVNWEHSSEPEHQIGYLTKAELIDPKQLPKYETALGVKLSKTATVFVEGELYKYVDKAEAVANLLKSAPAGKGLGLSLQGALARDAEKGDVLKAFVRGVAITAVPAHPRTLAQLAKSLRARPEKAEPCEYLDPSVKSYVDTAIQELRCSIQGPEPQNLNREQALMWILQRYSNVTLAGAEQIYEFAMKAKER